jgi:phage/plasmid-associated DNA primase
MAGDSEMGCLKWQKIGLSPPQAVIDATAAYLETEDTIATWIDERCECGKSYRDTPGISMPHGNHGRI